MVEGQPVIYVSTPVLVGTIVALLGTLVTLAVVLPPAAILFVIFGFLFGHRFLGYVTTEIGSELTRSVDETAVDGEPEAENPLEVLRERYARGELSDEEFDRKLEVLLATETIGDVEAFLGSDRTGAGIDLDGSTDTGDRDVSANTGDRDAPADGVEVDREYERS